jgi:DNA transformation protein
MAVSANFLDYVLDQLSGLGSVRSRRMFGGIGLYCDELFFGLIDDDIVYFKVDDSNRADYAARGCEPFRPFADEPKVVSMSYFRVPSEVLEDVDEIKVWARKAVTVASAAAAAKSSRNKKARPARRAAKKAKTARKR